MGIRDNQIDWIRKRIVYGPLDLNGLIFPAVNESGSQAFTEGELFQNPTAASKVAPEIMLREVGALGLVGLGYDATGDVILGYIHIPFDMNPDFPVGFRVNFTTNDSASGTASFILLTETIKNGVALTATINDALDTIIPLLSAVNTSLNSWTGRGIAKSLGLTRKDVEDGAILEISLELNAVATSSAGEIVFLGLEMDYVPQKTIGTGSELDAPLTSAL